MTDPYDFTDRKAPDHTGKKFCNTENDWFPVAEFRLHPTRGWIHKEGGSDGGIWHTIIGYDIPEEESPQAGHPNGVKVSTKLDGGVPTFEYGSWRKTIEKTENA